MERVLILCKQVITITLCLFFFGTKGYAQNAPSALAKAPQQGPRLYYRAPEAVPGTLPEMRTVDYWVSKAKNPDAVIKTISQIQQANLGYWQRIGNYAAIDSPLAKLISRKVESTPGLYAEKPDLYNKTPQKVAEITRDIITREQRTLRRGKYGNMLAVEYSTKDIDDLEAEMNLKGIASTGKVQPGVMVMDERLRIVPTATPELIGLNDKGKGRWDMWNLDMVPIGSPVQILHTSKSGQSVFICSVNGYGWVNTNSVAMGTRAQTEEFSQGNNFVVCKGDKVPFYTDATSKYASGIFRMGNRLPLSGTNPRQIKIPVRMGNGSVSAQVVWLAEGADVHKGYLPYTRRNVISQSIKLLDNIYDWTGGWFGRNHATALRDVFACFGFTLPPTGELMSAFNPQVKRVYTKEGKETVFKAILDNEPFITIQICSSGHSQLLMGNIDDMPIAYDTNGYGYVDDANREVELRRSAMVPVTIPDYFIKQDVIFVNP